MTQLPVLLINLARQPDRLLRMRNQLDALGVEFERIDAVDRLTAPPELFEERFSASGPLGPLGAGDMACTFSHRKAWQRVLELDAPAALILEDDIEASPALAEIVSGAGWIPKGAMFVKLDRLGKAKRRVLLGKAYSTPFEGRVLHPLYSRHLGAAGYIVTRLGAERALAASKVFSVPVDHFLFNPDNTRFAIDAGPLQMTPAAIRQAKEEIDSDIESSRPKARPNEGQFARQWRKVRTTLLRSPYLIRGARRVRVPFR